MPRVARKKYVSRGKKYYQVEYQRGWETYPQLFSTKAEAEKHARKMKRMGYK